MKQNRTTRTRSSGLTAAAFAVAALAPSAVAGQELAAPGPQVIDRVAAVVGDSIILLTQLEERILQMGASGMQTPLRGSPAYMEFRDEILESLINEQLLLQEAIRDTLITLDDERLDALVEDEWNSRAEQFPGGQAELVRELSRSGFTSVSYREFLRSQLAKQQLQTQLVQRRAQSMRSITVSEDEVQAFFDQQGDQLPEMPARITLKQAILQPLPSQEAKDSAKAEADRILEMFVTDEEEFEDLARRFSDDTGTQRNGGDLGWFRRGSGFVQEFEDAAFALFPGQVSIPIETVFGYHVIFLERIRGPERKARHILIAFELGEDDLAASQARASDLRTQVEEGGDLRTLSDELGDAVAMYDSATIATSQLQSLPPALGSALSVALAGTVVGPLDVGGRPGAPNLAVVQVLERREAGVATLEDLRPQIEGQLRQQKILEAVLLELRSSTYISVKL
jgi:peptidyl-prolyl cis-trans isomerase SurA